MVILGVILLIIGFVAKVHLLWIAGIVLAVVGGLLLAFGHRRGTPYGGRYYY